MPGQAGEGRWWPGLGLRHGRVRRFQTTPRGSGNRKRTPELAGFFRVHAGPDDVASKEMLWRGVRGAA